jgi:hypothetical protein
MTSPSLIFSKSVSPQASVANGRYTCGISIISVSERKSILPEKGGPE